MVEPTPIKIEVTYARPERQVVVELALAPGSTLGAAIRASGLLEQFPEIDLKQAKVGVFGKLSRLDAPLGDGDRVEIYRPLVCDPKQARRRRAALKAAQPRR